MAEMKTLTINGEQFTLPFAPSGYGLGMTAMQGTAIPDCNAAYANGWYLVNGDTANGIGALGVMRVDSVTAQTSSATARILQTIFTADLHGVAVVVQRACTKGTWGAWEYFNPPMVLGVEYRTTERWNGKVVYTKLVDCGAAPNASTKSVYVTDTSAINLIRWSGYATYSGIPLPTSYAGWTSYVVWNSNGFQFTLTTNADRSSCNVYVQVWYTKY